VSPSAENIAGQTLGCPEVCDGEAAGCPHPGRHLGSLGFSDPNRKALECLSAVKVKPSKHQEG